eukprot:14150613-Ditylum_brightwellii.AAC.1
MMMVMMMLMMVLTKVLKMVMMIVLKMVMTVVTSTLHISHKGLIVICQQEVRETSILLAIKTMMVMMALTIVMT